MTRHPVRKMFGLTVLYIFIIFGIFFIQFRKESIITKIFGPFQLIISETHDQNNQAGLANSFQLSVNGFSYSTNEADPVTLRKGGKDIPLTFTGYSGEDSTLALCFDNDVVLTWDSPDPEDIPYTIKAELPEGSESVTIPYRMISSFTTEDISSDEECRIILSQKETEYELKVADISESGLTLTTAMPRLSYGYKEEIHIFTFEDVAELELARQSVFTDTKQQLRSAVATAFPQAGFTASSEKAVMTWLAEQASRGNLTQSLNQIPDSLKTASGHTYFSAPYFDTLASVAPGLRKALADVESQVTNAVILNNPSVYEIDMLEMYLLTHGKAACHPVLDMAQDINISTLPLGQAGAILQLYVNLSSQKPEYASHLEPVLDSCIALFEKHAQLDGDKVILVEDEEPLDRITAAKAGLALAQTGTLRSDKTVQQAGYIILNSALSELYTLTVEELAELYPLFTPENKYYPHVALLDDSSTEPVWAWTVAQNMTFKSTAKGITEFTATFPQNGIHYMIVNGIKPFTTIQIYGMQFRTDPRFETYNSSGYVYQADSNTLLLKYRQRSETEVVTLDSSVPQPAATQAAAPAAPAATPAAETPAAAASPAASTATTPAAPASSAAPAATTPATSPAPATTTEQPIIKPGRSGASL